MSYHPRPLPEKIQQLFAELDAPPRLVAHLKLVHDVAVDICDGVRQKFPGLEFDHDSVCFGAAIHDLAKVQYRNELTGPGRQHEVAGPAMLEEHGVEPSLARFTRTHGSWSQEELPLEDLFVALSDCVWKGQRLEELERQVIGRIATQTSSEQWEVFSELDGLLEKIAAQGDERLAWQQKVG